MIKDSTIKKLEKYFLGNPRMKGLPSTDVDIKETENILNIKLDEDYVFFLKHYGACAMFGSFPIFGHKNAEFLEKCGYSESIHHYTKVFRDKNYFIINEGYVIGGDLPLEIPIVFGKDHKIHICLTNDDNFTIADNFEEFLLIWLKDELTVVFDYIKLKKIGSKKYNSYGEYKFAMDKIKLEIKKGNENDPKWVTKLRKYYSEHLDEIGKPANDEEIYNIEKELKIKLSEDYSIFLKCFGSGMIDVYPIFGFNFPADVLSVDNVIIENKNLRESEIPYSDEWLIISQDQGGNPIGIDENGNVYMHDQDFSEVVLLAKSFGKFVEKCINDTLFD